MRCPDCGKFVSMDNADPEVSSLEAELDGESIKVCCSVRAVRTCADCSTELKSLDLELEETLEIAALSGYAELAEENRTVLQELLAGEIEGGEIEVEVEEGGAETDESGGGRYKKNLLTTTVTADVTVTCTHPSGTNFTVEGQVELSEENPASAYEECC